MKHIIALCSFFFITGALLNLVQHYDARPSITKDLMEVESQASSPRLLGQLFTTLAKKDPAYAYEVLRRAQFPPNVDIHLLGHYISDQLYEQQGAKGMRYCTKEFRNACSHAIVAGMFMDKGPQALADIAQSCQKAPGGRGAYGMCFHGLGHGVLAYTSWDFQKAVNLCLTIPSKQHGREAVECIGGATMEIISGGDHDKVAWNIQSQKWLSNANPLSLCQSTIPDPAIRTQCWSYITPHLFVLAGADLADPKERYFETAFAYCAGIPPKRSGEREACFGGFGKEFVVLVNHRDIRSLSDLQDSQLQTLYTWCSYARTSGDIASCVRATTNSLYWGGENSPSTGVKFCTLIPSAPMRQECFTNLSGAVNYYETRPEARDEFCAMVPKEIQPSCVRQMKSKQ